MNTEAQFLGELSPLKLRERGRLPEKREISKRWLFSSVLVGLTSFFLMGGALYAALDGRQKLTVAATSLNPNAQTGSDIEQALRGNHPGILLNAKTEQSNVMMVSTISGNGDTRVVKQRPFMIIQAPLALASSAVEKYPAFNPLRVFSESGDEKTIAKVADFMYGANVDGELKLSVTEFPYEDVNGQIKQNQRDIEIQKQVAQLYAELGPISNIFYENLSAFDADRYTNINQESGIDGVVITPENVTVLNRTLPDEYPGVRYEERTIEIRAEATVAQIMELEGLTPKEALEVETVLQSDLGSNALQAGDRVETYFRNQTDSFGNIVKALAKLSLYRGSTHLISIGRNDADRLIYAVKPQKPDETENEADKMPLVSAKSLPSTYDGIYRSALYEGLTKDLAGSLIKIFAFDVDFKNRVNFADELEVFLSLEDGQKIATEESEILYASIKLGDVTRKYYRFLDEETGIVDYYDETGKSAKKFLLRKPVPNGKFRSAFGMRRHPISRRLKLHGGVDWSAPRGTPIIASGNGVITKIGWRGGNGRFTAIKHANGYETSYSHQTAYAKGMKVGARVRQGQIIGYVGSTGYSTGPHLHYEVKVNGKRVDPMRIRLPKGKVLKDAELAAFEAERDRIDTLIAESKENRVASN